jgi:hypothetical protein
MTKEFYTDYKTAAKWQCSLILCNEIAEIDPSVFENFRFNAYEDDEQEGDPIEIYQYFLTDLTPDGVDFMEETFNLKYTYPEMLCLFVLCVTHFGTSWDYVPCQVLSEDWAKVNKDKEFKK